MYGLYLMALAAIYGVSLIAALFSNKVRGAIFGRRGLIARVSEWKPESAPYWFHVASSGEFEQVIPILEALKKKDSRAPIFLTYFSPTAKRGVELETERRRHRGVAVPWDRADYAPLDFPGAVARFLEALKPRCFVAIHREIWPSTLRACHARQIPSYLFGSYISPKSQKSFGFVKRYLKYFKSIGTNNDATTEFLRAITAENPVPVETLGDPRIERVLNRRAMQKPPAWKSFFENQNIAIFASVWPKDFSGVSLGLATLTEKSWRTLIVPHEMDDAFFNDVIAWYKSRNLPIRLWSRWLVDPEPNSHLIVDKVGFLAELYQVASLVFVGGSFRYRIHNVLEPAAYGKPVITGPLIENSGEAMEMSRLKPGLVRTLNREEFAVRVKELIEQPELRKAIGENLIRYLNDRVGSGERYAERLLRSSHK